MTALRLSCRLRSPVPSSALCSIRKKVLLWAIISNNRCLVRSRFCHETPFC